MEIEVSPCRSPWDESVQVPGDKSLSHRALMLAALSAGACRIRGLSPGRDVRSTERCLRAMGMGVRRADGEVIATGWGIGWQEPANVLDCGNSGTTMRLLSGIVASHAGLSVLTGDASLRQRPMARVLGPLADMGAQVSARAGNRLAPLVIRGGELQGVHHRLAVASAQVKSCLLLAGLRANGTVRVEEPHLSRDHTERMLTHLGVRLSRDERGLELTPFPTLPAFEFRVPGDFSSAAFLLAAAVIMPGARVQITGVGLNPTRTAFLDLLQRMGARIRVEITHTELGEPVGDVEAVGSDLTGLTVPADMIAGAIDELPILAVVATRAEGTTHVRNAAELRHKESDRIRSVVTELRRMGASIDEHEDGFSVHGPTHLRGAAVQCHGDHRLEMSLAIAGMVARGKTRIRGAGWAAISFPTFWDLYPGRARS